MKTNFYRLLELNLGRSVPRNEQERRDLESFRARLGAAPGREVLASESTPTLSPEPRLPSETGDKDVEEALPGEPPNEERENGLPLARHPRTDALLAIGIVHGDATRGSCEQQKPHTVIQAATAVRAIIADTPGAREIGVGDECRIVSFPWSGDAVLAALILQQSLRDTPGAQDPLRAKIGIHIRQETKLHPPPQEKPSIADRDIAILLDVVGLASPGQILLTRQAYDDWNAQVAETPASPNGIPEVEIRCVPHGVYRLPRKGADPLDVFEIGRVGIAPFTAPDHPGNAYRGPLAPETLKRYLFAIYIALLVAGAAGGSKTMALGFEWMAAAVTVITFAPTIFIADVISQIFGRDEAKRFVWPGFVSLLIATGAMLLFVYIPPHPSYPEQQQQAYEAILTPPFRGVIAGLAAFVAGQLCNIWLFNRIRQWTTFTHRWIRNVGSTVVSQALDTLIFIPLAFYDLYGDGEPALLPLILGQLAIKTVIMTVCVPLFLWLTRLFRNADAPARVPPPRLG